MINGSIFDLNPTRVSGQRSLFDNTVPGNTSFNYGRIYPVFTKFVQPGDTLSEDLGEVIRGATPIVPVMGDASIEYMAFFVPHRLVWNHTKQMMGENDTSAWTQLTNYEYPKIRLCVGDVYKVAYSGSAPTVPASHDLFKVYDAESASGSDFYVDLFYSSTTGANRLSDYIGVNPSVLKRDPGFYAGLNLTDGTHKKFYIEVNALPFRAYWQIWNDFFRDENYQGCVLFSKDDATLTLEGANTDTTYLSTPFDNLVPYIPQDGTITAGRLNGAPMGAFTLPACKKHDCYTSILPEAQKGTPVNILAAAGLVPITTGDEFSVSGNRGMRLARTDGGTMGDYNLNAYSGSGAVFGVAQSDPTGTHNWVAPSNLYADLSKDVGLTLNAFRQAVVTNQWMETSARVGSRYNETILGFFGVSSPDASIQRAQFLGGVKVPVHAHQVAQTAPNSDGSGVGDTGAFTYNADDSSIFTHSFTEWGTVMILAVPRIDRMYVDPIDPQFYDSDKFDLYWPLMDAIGEQPIKQKVVFPSCNLIDSGGNSAFTVDHSDDTFGFNEAWYFMRFKEGKASGIMSPNNPLALSYWSYCDQFGDRPQPGPLWISAYDDATIVDRTLALGSEASRHCQQIVCNLAFRERAARKVSVRSVPGLHRI